MQSSRARGDADAGFTLVELLVVTIILGILAAIAIPTFLAQKRNAYEAAAKSDVQAIARAVAAFYVDDSGPLALRAGSGPVAWELADGASEVVAAGALSTGNTVDVTSTILSDTSYCVAVVPSATGARAWKATQTGLAAGDCP